MLSQSHLSPFPMPVQPVHWELDGALSLFPQPDLLVIAEPGPVQDVTVAGVRCACGQWVVGEWGRRHRACDCAAIMSP